MPVSRGWPSRLAQNAFRLGWLVFSLMDAIAQSTTSHPASTMARFDARLTPLVECVWKWIGKSGFPASAAPLRIAAISGLAWPGFTRPAMSLIASIWAPASAICLATPWKYSSV